MLAKRTHQLSWLALPTLLASFLCLNTAWGRDFVVNSVDNALDANPGDGVCETAAGNTTCTLRAAVAEMMINPGGKITLPAGNFVLNNGANNGPHGALLIDGDITIDGAGSAETIIDANALSRLIQIRRRSGTVAIPNVKLSNMSLQNGATFSSTDENERDGGAIDIRSGQITITHVSFLNNHAYRQGGAINNSGRLEIKGATFETNSAGNLGGALASNDALSVINSEFNGNHALEGGAIAIAAGNASLTSSTFINNDALDQGGALFVVDGNVTAANLTLVFNTADTHQAAGLALVGGSTALNNSIVAFNTNSDGVARNCSPNKLPVDGGHNLQFPAASCGATIAVTDPKLGHFGDNGGPTRSLLPLSLSPTIDAIEINACSLTDQRGVTRVDGDGDGRTACDIGAAEYTPPQAPRADLSVTVSDSVDPVFGAGDITYTLTAFNKGPAPATGVIVSYTLPDRMSLALSPLGCTNSAKIIKCNVGDLAVNTQRQFQFLVRPTLDTPSTATSRVPKLSADDISIREGNGSDSVVSFAAKLSPVATQPVTVEYSVTGGTANAETDFVATSGKLTFSPGQSQLQIPVTIKGDTRYEPSESLILTLKNPVGALLGNASASATIENDDKPILTFSPPATNVAINEKKSLTLNLEKPAGAGGVSIALSSLPANSVTFSSTLVVPAGATSATFNVTSGAAVGPVVLTATTSEYVSAKITLNVKAIP